LSGKDLSQIFLMPQGPSSNLFKSEASILPIKVNLNKTKTFQPDTSLVGGKLGRNDKRKISSEFLLTSFEGFVERHSFQMAKNY